MGVEWYRLSCWTETERKRTRAHAFAGEMIGVCYPLCGCIAVDGGSMIALWLDRVHPPDKHDAKEHPTLLYCSRCLAALARCEESA